MMRRGARGPPCRCPRPEPERDRLAKGHGCTQRRTASRSRAEGTPCRSGPRETAHCGSRTGAAEGTPYRNGLPLWRALPCAERRARRRERRTRSRTGERDGAARPASAKRREACRRVPAETGVCLRGACRRPRGKRLRRGRSARLEGTAEPRTGAARGAARRGTQAREISRGGEAAGPLRPHVIRQRRVWTGSSGRCTGHPYTRAYCRRPLRR